MLDDDHNVIIIILFESNYEMIHLIREEHARTKTRSLLYKK